jgi:hypothetical protein
MQIRRIKRRRNQKRRNQKRRKRRIQRKEESKEARIKKKNQKTGELFTALLHFIYVYLRKSAATLLVFSAFSAPPR